MHWMQLAHFILVENFLILLIAHSELTAFVPIYNTELGPLSQRFKIVIDLSNDARWSLSVAPPRNLRFDGRIEDSLILFFIPDIFKCIIGFFALDEVNIDQIFHS